MRLREIESFAGFPRAQRCQRSLRIQSFLRTRLFWSDFDFCLFLRNNAVLSHVKGPLFYLATAIKDLSLSYVLIMRKHEKQEWWHGATENGKRKNSINYHGEHSSLIVSCPCNHTPDSDTFWASKKEIYGWNFTTEGFSLILSPRKKTHKQTVPASRSLGSFRK